ncbi:MAG: chemotaxis protein CheB [Planctomycetota bacterium]
MSDQVPEDQVGEAQASPGRCEYVVGVGASAGGLEALEAFFNHLPEETRAAYVVVQHLSPDFKSHMESLLSRQTGMNIRRVENEMKVEPNTIYLIPARKVMVISDQTLLLTDADPAETVAHPIDHFFRSLATDLKSKAVGVILSGTGSDGSRGMIEIKKAHGLTLVQDPGTARFDGMPLSAINTNHVDLTLPPETMGPALARYIEESLSPTTLAEQELQIDYPNLYDEIFDLLQAEYKINFADYKAATIGRRVQRRLAMRSEDSLEDYVKVLGENRAELDLLYHDLLIGVTRFFRDPDAFSKIATTVIPELFQRVRRGEPLRLWVPACATGEEAYSLSILVHEISEKLGDKAPFKIFATDIHQAALTSAARGIYPAEAIEGLTKERRERYFDQVGEAYRIKRLIRESIVFARHNLLEQPPFTQMDLISCRNLLIYFQPEAQRKVLSLFHFALKSDGHLILGPSETVGTLEDEFTILDKRWRIFRKRRDVRLPLSARYAGAGTGMVKATNMNVRRRAGPEANPLAPVFERLLENYMPPSLLVDEDLSVLHLFGGVEKLLQFKTGRLSTHVLDLVGEEMKSALAGALHHASRDNKLVRYSGVRFPSENGSVLASMVVEPIHDPRTRTTHLMVRFDVESRPNELHEASGETASLEIDLDVAEATRQRVGDLESELQYARENLQATVEELETANEELQASNEELVASNEELQSTNEELHSVNEELYTFNTEYQQTIEEVRRANDDMDNLLSATGVGVIFLDEKFNIRRFTPRIAAVFNLMQSDVGRPIDTFAHSLSVPTLMDDLYRVVDTRQSIENEVSDSDGRPYFLQILPYVGDGNEKVTGAVITLLDITPLREAENSATQFKFIADHGPDRQSLVDARGRFVYVNHALCKSTGYSVDELIGQPVTLVDPAWSVSRYRSLFDDVFDHGPQRFESNNRSRDGRITPVEISLSSVEIDGRRLLYSNARDISDRRAAEDRLSLEHEISLAAVGAGGSGSEADFQRFLGPFIRSLDSEYAAFWMLQPSETRAAADRRTPAEDRLERVAHQSGEQVDPLVVEHLLSDDEPVRYGHGPLGKTWETQRAVLYEDHSPTDVLLRHRGAVPICYNDKIFGVLSFAMPQAAHEPELLVVTLNTVGRIVGQYYQRQKIEKDLSLRDRAIESTRDGIVIADAQQKDLPLIYVNRGFEEITGYSAEEVVGLNCRFLQNGDTDQADLDILRDAIEAKRACQVTLRNYRKNGQMFYNDLQLSPVTDDSGEVVNFVAVQHDITKRISDERRLEEARRAASAANMAKSEFVANISHEIRTPMTAILGFADALGREVTSEKTAELVATIRRNGDYLLALINDILDLSKIEAGKLDIDLSSIDLPSLIDDLRSLMDVRANEAGLPLRFDAPDSIPAVIQSDKIRLRQILVNLISNALKFTPSGRVQVVVEAGRWDAGGSDTEHRTPGPIIRFKVIDTGIGIAESEQEMIFRPFAQISRAESMGRVVGGTGLGLSITKRLVDRMGGQLTLESKLGEGSTFTVELPIGSIDNASWVKLEERSPSDPTPIEEVGLVLTGSRILVADDRRDVARVARFYLEEAGAAVEVVENGREAVDTAWAAWERGEPYTAILMDMQMPVMSGIEATIELRQRGYTGGIIALTAGAMNDEAARTLEAGCDEFLAKPVIEQRLIEAIVPYTKTD